MDQLPSIYLLFSSFTLALGSFQFGYHIGELNTPQKVISCEVDPHHLLSESPFPPCISMDAFQISLVTSIFTLGGLVGSLLASRVADSKGRRWTLLFSNLFLFVGSLFMGFASSIADLVIGRILVGIGSGVAVVVVPMYLVEISAPENRGAFGVMNQLGIVFGILLAQVEGYFLSNVSGWRVILLTGAVISLIQTILLAFIEESPRYLASKPGGFNAAKRVLQKLRGTLNVDDELKEWQKVAVEEGLVGLISNDPLENESQSDDNGIVEAPTVVFRAQNLNNDINLWKLINNPHYRPALVAVSLLQLAQQFSGINAVIFYSTSILSELLPNSSDLVTVYISIVNVIMTIVSAILIDKTGRRPLLLFSIFSMAVASTTLAFSITNDSAWLSAISIIAFVATFAIGLGPIPFLINPEMVDTHAAATASSLALSANWVANFLVAFLFLSVKKALGGNVFYCFSVILVFAFLAVNRYVPETKGKTVEEVWGR